MRLNWLNKKNNNNLIIFFNGWGMDDNVISHLDYGNYDVLTICDYNTLTELPDITAYKQRHIIAWSMGVMVATIFETDPTSATAINGTPYPIHQEFGINPKVYRLMELGFSDETKNDFYTKMFNVLPANFTPPTRDTKGQKTELTALRAYSANQNFTYSRIIVSNNDKIIPTKSQLNYWETPEIIEGGHCIFYQYNKWEELL